jgi:NAD(P)-dependent dehydrogenase (short-subunit alcohol dehydrogenase family)
MDGAIPGVRQGSPDCAHGSVAYRPSKAALIAATRDLAVLYGRDGIRCNAIVPCTRPVMRMRNAIFARALAHSISCVTLRGIM